MRDELAKYADRLNVPLVVFSAGIAFFACALLAGCGLVAALLWNFTFPGGGGGRPTPRATIERIAVTDIARATETVITTVETGNPTPTLLPLFTPNLPPTTGFVLPSAPAPEQAVREYYQLVGEKRYEASWPRLSDTFKQIFNCCAPNYDYAGYSEWCDSVNRVEFGEVRTVSQTDDRAVVYAELFYHMNAGGVSRDAEPYIELIYDPVRGWLFEDKGETTSGRR